MDPLEWLEQNVNHLEHGGVDPTGFWPHKCEDCCYYESDSLTFDEGGCTLDCLRYRDLKLVDYVALRVKEAPGELP